MASRRHQSSRQRWSRFISQGATAALLLLVLALGLLAISLRPSAVRDEQSWQPVLAQALANVPGVVDTSLIETTFTPAELPDGEKEAVFYQVSLPPDSHLPYPGGLFCGCRVETYSRAVGMEFVQTGVYSLRLNAPIRVQRAGSEQSDEIIGAGTDVVLAAGDAVVYLDYASPGDIRNAGAEPVTVIGVVINATAASGTRIPRKPVGMQATMLSHASPSTWQKFPPGLLHVALRQVALPLGITIGPYQPVGLQAIFVASGTVVRNFVQAGESAPTFRPLPQRAGATVPFLALSDDRRETLASEGDQAADLIALIIEPAVNNLYTMAP